MQKFLFLLFALASSISYGQVSMDTTITSVDLHVLGEIDAQKNYQKYKAAGTGTLITSLVSPIIGLIPAIATSASQPKITNLNYPNEALFLQKEYYQSYSKKAKKIKQRKVWTNWAIGFGTNILLGAVLLNRLEKNGYF